MRYTRLAVGLLMLLALPAAAQQGRGMGMGPGGMGRMGPPQSGQGMFQGITLTTGQQAQVDAIWQSYAPVREEMHGKMMGGQMAQDTALRAQMMGMRKAHLGHFRTVLTPEQAVVFDENVKRMNEMPMGRGMGMGRGGPSSQ